MNDDTGLNIPIDKGYLLGILTDALEGGMADWAQVDIYDWPRWYEGNDISGDIKPEVEGDYVLLKVRDHFGGDDDDEFVDVTVDLMEQSTQWALVHQSQWLPYTVKDGVVDTIDYDAVGADIILQRAVLGEVVYG
ncbi:unnamed protein product [marine sediment metagenome]|uniref:Uncharacterized protein n=1 Tax=marine sediment metagenome TaxID=412755 RepID=X0TB13_9ZZZZ